MFIRKANQDDLETLLNFGEQLHLVEKEFEPLLKYSKKEYRQKYLTQLKNPLALFLILEDEGKTSAGYLYAHANKNDPGSDIPECELEVIYISPKFRGKGLSEKLINECINWAKKNNFTKINTEIFPQNTISINFFKKNGFSLSSSVYSLDIK